MKKLDITPISNKLMRIPIMNALPNARAREPIKTKESINHHNKTTKVGNKTAKQTAKDKLNSFFLKRDNNQIKTVNPKEK